jgi:hypothetical protein
MFVLRRINMKFDEICDLVLLGEADYDTLTGKAKVFSLADDAKEKVLNLDLNDIKYLIRRTTLPFTHEYLTHLVMEELLDYLPAETPDLKKMLKRNVWAKFDDTEKKSARAANVLFAFLKKKRLIYAGIKKAEEEKIDDEDLESISKDLERRVIGDPETGYSSGRLSRGDI